MLKEKTKIFDLAILGAGPAALTAGIYASRYKIEHLLIGEQIGGQVFSSYQIGNYPSEKEILGADLAKKMEAAALAQEVKIKRGKIEKIIKKKEIFSVFLEENEEIKAKTLILATGSHRKKLGLEEEEKFLGQGVHYCFTCDGIYYQDKIAAMVGGGNSALTGALYLASLAKKVFLICLEKNQKELLAEPYWQEKVFASKKIEIIFGAKVNKFLGNEFLQGIKISAVDGEDKHIIKLDGVFVEIGSVPNLPVMNFKLKLTKEGLVATNSSQGTNIKGFFSAGDLTAGSNKFKQIVTAQAEGAIAVSSVYSYLNAQK